MSVAADGLTEAHLDLTSPFWRAIFKAFSKLNMVDIAQLVSASDCGSEGRGFESHYPPQKKRGYPFGYPLFFCCGLGFEESGQPEGLAKKCPVDTFLARGRIPWEATQPVRLLAIPNFLARAHLPLCGGVFAWGG